MRNFALKLVGETGVRFFSFLFIFILARQVGAAAFGVYSTAFAFTSIFMIIVDLGMTSIVTREIARDPPGRQKLLSTSSYLKAGAALTALVAIDLVGRWSDIGRQHHVLLDELGVVAVAYTLIEYLAALLTGKEEMGWEAFLKIACRSVIALCGIVMLFATHSLERVISAMAVASLLSLAMGAAIVVARFGGFSWHFDVAVMRKLMLSSLPLLGSVVFWIFYDNQDILLLHHFRVPEREIGLFWSASKVVDVLKVFPVLLTGVFFPKLSRFTVARESFLETCRELIGLAAVTIPILALPVYVAARRVETLFYGPQFSDAGPLLQRLLFAFIAISMNHLCMQILIAKNLERKLLGGAMLACLSNFAITWWLIPIQGPIGVCNALILSEVLYLAFQVHLVLGAVPGLANPLRKTFG